MEPVDGLAFIGRNPGEDNVFVVTGDSGQGMTHGTIAGILIPDLILGRDNPWAALYDPARKSVRSAGEFASENINVARQYTDFLTPGDVKSADDIPPGQGAILRHGLSKVAVYREPSTSGGASGGGGGASGGGGVVFRGAKCPHLGCIVQWNDLEKSWDCPCHGSRFAATGEVLNGPANERLAESDPPNEPRP
jgi:Rieske Fe-S protein